MIPLGAIHFTPAQIAMILVVLTVGAIVLALPATLTLAWVGHRRRGRARTALWYWFAGTALSLATTAFAADHDLGWWSVPLGWVPTLLLAAVLDPRWPRREARLGGTTTGQQGER